MLSSAGGSVAYKAPCPLAAHISEGMRRHVISLCQLRHREQHLYTTNGSSAGVSVGGAGEETGGGAARQGAGSGAGSASNTGNRKATFMLKLEGKRVRVLNRNTSILDQKFLYFKYDSESILHFDVA